MNVQDIMKDDVATCRPWSNLAEVAMMMWNHDCGVIPVLSEHDTVTAVITDRDICMAVATQHRRAEEIAVSDITNGHLYTCRPDDAVSDVLQVMQDHKVRRLPVIDGNGHLLGMVSLNDVIVASHTTKTPSYAEVIRTLKAIGTPEKTTPVVPDYHVALKKRTTTSSKLKGKLWKDTKTSGLSS